MSKYEIYDLLFYTLLFGVFSKIEADIFHFEFFTKRALKSRVSFENSFHVKQPMIRQQPACAAPGRVCSIASFATLGRDYFTVDCATLQRDKTENTKPIFL